MANQHHAALEWACKCGPHPVQRWSLDRTSTGPLYAEELMASMVPLLCLTHKRHLPCKKCDHANSAD